MKTYTREEAILKSTEYFGGETLPADVFVTKYALRNDKLEILEQSPEQMHRRLAREFARIENKYKNPISEEEIFNLFDRFKYIIPQGSPMFGIGNPYQKISISNCFAMDVIDSYGGICRADERIAQISKRRGGCVEENSFVKIKDKGIIKIKDVNIGDKILSYNLEGKKSEYQTILDKYYTDVKKENQIKITLSNGFEIRTSKTHPILVLQNGKHEYKKAGELKEKDVCIIPEPQNLSFDELLKFNKKLIDIGWFIGAHTGDGSLGMVNKTWNKRLPKGLRLRILGDNESVVRNFAQICNNITGSKSQYTVSSRKIYKTKCWEYYNNTNALFSMAKKYFDNKIGQKCYDCHVFSFVEKHNLWVPYLAGLLDTDGHIRKDGKIDLCLCAKDIIYKLSSVLAGAGIRTFITVRFPRRANEKAIYRLNITDENFYSIISPYLRHDIKQKTLKAAIKTKRIFSLTYPLVEKEVEQIIKEYNSRKYCRNIIKNKKHTNMIAIIGLLKKYHAVGLGGLMVFKEFGLLTQNKIEEILQRKKIKSIEEEKENLQYIDISVENNNNYYAGSRGLINIHNCGMDISALRPKGQPTKNSAFTTDGIVVFMERFSNTAREVAQSGRRGALLLSISVHHPEVLNFIRAKLDLKKITGANISVKITDEFMDSLKKDKMYEQRWPVDSTKPVISQQVKAKEVWDELIKCAHRSGEPGILFIDTIIKNSPAASYSDLGYKEITTNPCITGDTIVYVADGRGNISIKQLAQENKDVPVFCYDNSGNVVVRKMRNPRITGFNQPIYKIKLDDGYVIRCTENHSIRLRDGTYKEAKKLIKGDSLQILVKTKSPMPSKIRSTKCGIKYINEDPRVVKNLSNMSEQGYTCKIENNIVMVKKHCEGCGKEFWVEHFNREVGYCSVSCASTDRSMAVKKDQCNVFALLKNTLLRTPRKKEWEAGCKKNNISFKLGVKNRFKSYSDLRESAEYFNHRVVSVEIDGCEDVYNGTVDEFHNFFIGGFEGKTKDNRDKWLYVNNLNCGELPLGGNLGSCILLLQNLLSYVINPFTNEARFNEELFAKNTRIAQKLLDDMVDLELEAIDKIIEKIKLDPEDDKIKANELDLWNNVKKTCGESRRTGLGITGLGDCIAMLNVKYGSKESLKIVEKIYSVLRDEAYRSSVEMAKDRGPFSIWDAKKEKDNEFLNRLPDDILKEMKKVGRRNIACLTTSPAGSVSVLSQTSSGFEPVFMAEYKRKRKLTENDKDKPDYIDDVGDKWKEYVVEHNGLKLFKKITGKEFKDSPYYGAQAQDIDYEMRVKMQAMATKYTCHAISSTINLPNNTDIKTVDLIYRMAYTEGCKGLTVYRDGSRDGVFTKNETKNNTRNCEDCDEASGILRSLVQQGQRPSSVILSPAPKRPDVVECEIQRSKIGGGDWLFFVGLMGISPYEVFGGDAEEFTIPHKYKKGWIVKNGKNKDGVTQYNLVLGSLEDPNEKLEFKGIAKHFNNKEYGAFTRVISLCLRHGVPIKYICEQLIKTGCEGDLFSFQRAMSRILKKYISDGERSGGECPMCHSEELYYKNGCPTCKICGHSNCL